jgi:hypothetical protein
MSLGLRAQAPIGAGHSSLRENPCVTMQYTVTPLERLVPFALQTLRFPPQPAAQE